MRRFYEDMLTILSFSIVVLRACLEGNITWELAFVSLAVFTVCRALTSSSEGKIAHLLMRFSAPLLSFVFLLYFYGGQYMWRILTDIIEISLPLLAIYLMTYFGIFRRRSMHWLGGLLLIILLLFLVHAIWPGIINTILERVRAIWRG
jgi:hypothetical protein